MKTVIKRAKSNLGFSGYIKKGDIVETVTLTKDNYKEFANEYWEGYYSVSAENVEGNIVTVKFGHLRIEPYKEATETEISNVLDVLKGIDLANRQAIVNYSMKYDETACKEKAREIYQKNDGKFVTYGGCIGRLKYNEAENYYYFMKKGARSKGYYINERQICTGVKEV